MPQHFSLYHKTGLAESKTDIIYIICGKYVVIIKTEYSGNSVTDIYVVSY